MNTNNKQLLAKLEINVILELPLNMILELIEKIAPPFFFT